MSTCTTDTDDASDLIAEAHSELSSVEATEVRFLVRERSASSEASLVALAMSAPSLATAAARVIHADLLPLFADEQRRFHAVFQPIVTLLHQSTFGYEALLRAETPEGLR